MQRNGFKTWLAANFEGLTIEQIFKDGGIEDGIAGPPGADGAPGAVWRSGTGAPSNGTGINGDFYLNDANGDVYKRTAGTYSVVANIKGLTGDAGADGATGATGAPSSVVLAVAVSDETTDITTGTAKVTIRIPQAMTLTAVRASLTTESSSGAPQIDINKNGSTILSTKLTIDANEKTSVTAATPAVISDTAMTDDAEITIDIDTAGTGAKGLKVYLIGTV